MLFKVDKKYCIRNHVLYPFATDQNQIVVGKKNILFLKIDGQTLIDQNLSKIDGQSSADFEFNNCYVTFKGSLNDFRISRQYFFKSENGALAFDDDIPIEKENGSEITSIISRKEVEALFDKNAYDGMYVFNSFGMISFASCKHDKFTFGSSVIPKDHKIAQLDLRNRLWRYNMARTLGDDCTMSIEKRRPRMNSIDEIREVPLFGPMGDRKFSHLLLTVKDGQFNLQWFKLDFVKLDTFRLTIKTIFVKEPTVDDVVELSLKNEIRELPSMLPQGYSDIEGESAVQEKGDKKIELKPLK